MNRFTCRAFGPDMVKRNKGHIVEIASMSSFLGVGVFSDYSACKTALISFTESESFSQLVRHFHVQHSIADVQVSENNFEDGTQPPMCMSLSSTPCSSKPT